MSQLNGDPTENLSTLLSCLKSNIYPHEGYWKSNVQLKNTPKSTLQHNISHSNALERPEKGRHQFHPAVKGENLFTLSMDIKIQIPQKWKDDSTKRFREVRRFDKGGRGKIRNINTNMLKSSIYSNTGFQSTPSAKREEAKRCPQEIPKKLAYVCKVCGDTASNYIHYGGRSCHSCRAFFRRSIEAASRYIN